MKPFALYDIQTTFIVEQMSLLKDLHSCHWNWDWTDSGLISAKICQAVVLLFDSIILPTQKSNLPQSIYSMDPCLVGLWQKKETGTVLLLHIRVNSLYKYLCGYSLPYNL